MKTSDWSFFSKYCFISRIFLFVYTNVNWFWIVTINPLLYCSQRFIKWSDRDNPINSLYYSQHFTKHSVRGIPGHYGLKSEQFSSSKLQQGEPSVAPAPPACRMAKYSPAALTSWTAIRVELWRTPSEQQWRWRSQRGENKLRAAAATTASHGH